MGKPPIEPPSVLSLDNADVAAAFDTDWSYKGAH